MSDLRQRMVLPIALGLADGVLNALTLASASLVGDAAHVTVLLALRIAVAALVTAGFSVFVGSYAEARSDLRDAARQLSLPAGDRLNATDLGQRARRRALEQAGLASAASLLGALIPLLIAAALPGPGWIAAAVAICALGILGVGLATTVLGNRPLWSAALVAGGIAVTAVGVAIKIT